MTLKKNINERGFTIVELLIVIIVIGILATLVLLAYNNVQAQARDAKRQANATSLRDAAATFKGSTSVGNYPTNTATGSPNFASDIGNSASYTNGTVPITVDPTVIANISSTIPTAAAWAAAPDTIAVTYCPAASSPTAATATGMSFGWYSETKKAAQTPVTTGTGCP